MDGKLIYTELRKDHERFIRYWIQQSPAFTEKQLSGHVSTEQILLTENHVVRVNQMPDGTYRYASWSKKTLDINTPDPDLTLSGGVLKTKDLENYYSFWNGEYNYLVPTDETNMLQTIMPDRATVKEVLLSKYHTVEIQEMSEE